GGGYYGDSEPSAIVRSNADALMYFDIAANLGHPLAKDYVGAHQAAMSQYGDIPAITADAAARARNWAPPFEYYPGATAGGVPHSDEGLPNLVQRRALARVPEIPFPAFEKALTFRGLLRGRQGPWRAASPADVAQAVRKFQSALNFEPSGFLRPHEAVRLIRMSAVDGDASSQNRLGIMYAKGIGVPQNFPRAEKWFFLAARQHHGEAIYNLGVLYKVGPNGVEQDKDKAARLFAESALAGFNPTNCELRELLSQAADTDRNRGARR
ncbi:MAG TPA: tetratricopeptide repeat protein, partial [Rhizomicrobium sp.]